MDTPLWSIYIPHFGQISVKISVLGSNTLIVAPMGWNLARMRGPWFSPLCQISPPIVQRVASALRGEKPQNRPLSNLNNRRFALRAMLPVNCQQQQNVLVVYAAEVFVVIQYNVLVVRSGYTRSV